MSADEMSPSDRHDLIIIGGGIGGVICLKYARDAGLDAVLLERKAGVGGIWRDLPAWQDIQFRKEDWTLGSIPISGEQQADILGNIQAWVDQFDLSPFIRLNSTVSSARPEDDGWSVSVGEDTYHSRFLVAATGGHNRAVIPEVDRSGTGVREYHSSTFTDPHELGGKDVVVVGGGASAYDLLDLCFANDAARVVWVYRTLKWMQPTLKAKYYGTDMRLLARQQILGTDIEKINRAVNATLRSRYRKAGIEDILPEGDFDFRRNQLIPGRRGMITNFARIARHRGEIAGIDGRTIELSDGTRVEADLLLWATGYEVDMGYFDVESLSRITRLDDLAHRCGSLFLSLDAPNLFFLAPGVLETTTSTPWAYAHVCRSIVSHISGNTVFDTTPIDGNVNHYDLLRFLARRDRASYIPGLWYLKYLYTAFRHPKDRAMPMP